LKVQTRWLSSGGDPVRSCWCHVAELTLAHLRPSPVWIKPGEELQLAKDCEHEIRQGLKRLAARKRKEAEQRRMLA
jgi:hypothetical protein